METLNIRLYAKAARTAITIEEYIQTRLNSGVSIETIQADLITDLNEGGRIFGEFRKAIKATADGNMTRIRDNAQFAENGLDIKYQWVAVLVNTCPDCMDRHGEVKTWEEWETEGMPRTGATVCGDNCHCALIPARVVTDKLEPIQRGEK
jgi:hypothetical protein